MADYASDEEQVEALKRWWKENGTSLLTGVVIVLALYFGINQLQNSRENTAAQASALYQQISDLALNNTQVIAENDLLAAQAVYSQLKSEHVDSIYTRYAALVMARFQVENQQLEMAATELQWILDNPDLGLMREADPELFYVASLRLAKIRLAQGDAQAALTVLNASAAPEQFTAAYAEVEGDAQLELGNEAVAIESYQQAITAMNALGSGNPALLQLKLQELGINPSEL